MRKIKRILIFLFFKDIFSRLNVTYNVEQASRISDYVTFVCIGELFKFKGT